MGNLILLRHGESEWNSQNRFTGWVDVELSEKGKEEARKAGQAIEKTGLSWAAAHSSKLKRAQKTLEIVLKELGQNPPVTFDSALNERAYGHLQGMNKDEARAQFGEEQVHLWRRSFDVPPPGGESLQDTSKRTLPYFRHYILPEVMAGRNVLIVAHGNSLRAIVMELEKLTPEQILQLNLDTGVPYHYVIDAAGQIQSKVELKN